MHPPSFAAPPCARPPLPPPRVSRAWRTRHPCVRPRPRAQMAAAHPSGESVASRIARTFVAACAPGETPYAEAVRDFCRSALYAYRVGYTLSALRVELSLSKSARVLMADEAELRDVWLSLVYKTLRLSGFPGAGDALSVPDKFDEFVRDVIAAVRAGYDLRRIQLEQALRRTESDRPRTTLESAILNQSTRLVIATLDVAQSHMGSGEPPSQLPYDGMS